MTKRFLAATAATALLATALTAVGMVAPAAACACGALAPPEGMTVTVGQEVAMVTFDGTTQRIDMVLDMLADGADTGLIVPTPAPATVSLGETAVFSALERQTAPVVEVVEEWWGSPGDGSAGAAPTVISEVDLGPIQATTLAASDAAGLQAWLAANGYRIDPAVEELFADYIARGWSFAALKLTSEGRLTGGLDPVRLEFATSEMVYPLLLSQAASIPQTVRLYLFGDDGMQATFPDGTVAGEVAWAGPVEEAVLVQFGPYLTVVEAYFADPATEITGDLTVTSTGSRSDYTPVVTRTKYVQIGGIPLGVAIAGVASVFGAMVLLVVIGGIVHRRGERRRNREW